MPTPPVVLVIEDHSELLEVLLEALTWVGYEVVPARSGAHAATVLRSRPIDLLVSDPPPREGDSIALAALEAEFPEVPIVALAESRSGEGVFFRPWVTTGNRRTLRRPFRLQDFIAACRDAVPVSSGAPGDGEAEGEGEADGEGGGESG